MCKTTIEISDCLLLSHHNIGTVEIVRSLCQHCAMFTKYTSTIDIIDTYTDKKYCKIRRIYEYDIRVQYNCKHCPDGVWLSISI